MTRINPIFTAAVVAGLILLTMIPGPRRCAAVQQPLAGNLFSADSDTPTAHGVETRQDELPLPELRVSLDESARAALPPGFDFIVHLVPEGLSKIKLTMAKSPTPPTYHGIVKKLKAIRWQAHKTSKKKLEGVIALTPAAAAQISTSTPTQPSAQAAAEPPAPTRARTFVELDEALRAASTTQTVNLRIKLGGVTFRITAVGRFGDQQVIRYAIANEEDSDFFVSIVNVSAAGKPIRSETAGPYSCAAGSEVYGIVHFVPVASQTVAVELVQSGGQHRHFSLRPDIPF